MIENIDRCRDWHNLFVGCISKWANALVSQWPPYPRTVASPKWNRQTSRFSHRISRCKQYSFDRKTPLCPSSYCRGLRTSVSQSIGRQCRYRYSSKNQENLVECQKFDSKSTKIREENRQKCFQRPSPPWTKRRTDTLRGWWRCIGSCLSQWCTWIRYCCQAKMLVYLHHYLSLGTMLVFSPTL